MLQHALEVVKQGKRVWIIAADGAHRENLMRRFFDLCETATQEANVIRVGDGLAAFLTATHTGYDWERNTVLGSRDEVLVDHYAVEHRYDYLFTRAHRWDQ